MKIIAGYSSVNLTNAICKILNIQPIDVSCKHFSDGEITVSITPNVAQNDTCILIHSL